MKKSDIILVGIVVVIVVMAIVFSKGTSAQEDINFPLTLSGEPGLNQLTYNEYAEKVENGETFVVIIERTGCSYCSLYMPIVEEYANENKIPIFYIDTDTLTEDEFNELSTKNNYLKKNQWGTPTTLFMMGSKVIDNISGYVEKDSVDAFFKDRVVMGEE